jgi:hypothetical protein
LFFSGLWLVTICEVRCFHCIRDDSSYPSLPPSPAFPSSEKMPDLVIQQGQRYEISLDREGKASPFSSLLTRGCTPHKLNRREGYLSRLSRSMEAKPFKARSNQGRRGPWVGRSALGGVAFQLEDHSSKLSEDRGCDYLYPEGRPPRPRSLKYPSGILGTEGSRGRKGRKGMETHLKYSSVVSKCQLHRIWNTSAARRLESPVRK